MSHLQHLGGKSRPCLWCGLKAREPFCKRCYGFLDGATKLSMRTLFAKGAPRPALRLGVRCLEALGKSGVRVPERRTKIESEVEA